MKKIILPAIVGGIAMFVIGMIWGVISWYIFPSLIFEYQNTIIFRTFTDPRMMIFYFYPFVLSFILAWVFNLVKPVITGVKSLHRGLKFGAIYWLLTLMGLIITWGTFQISFLMICAWSIGIFIQVVIASWIYAAMNK